MVPDYRTTLYWNPAVELDETGHAVVEFYTSDAPADYNVTAEGVTREGKIICIRKQVATPEQLPDQQAHVSRDESHTVGK